ncbi:MAG: response regulator [Nitrospirae bacterium YQR-1]
MKEILLIEDDLSLRKQLVFALEKFYKVFEAGARQEALNILASNTNIDVSIIDLGLPPTENTPKEGLMLIEHIIAETKCKVVVLTGQETDMASIESIKLGVFDFLPKPAPVEKILYAVERALVYQKAEDSIEKEGIRKISLNVKLGDGLQSIRDEAEKQLIKKVLTDTDFNVYKTAKIMGIKRENIYYFLKKFGLKRDKNES